MTVTSVVLKISFRFLDDVIVLRKTCFQFIDVDMRNRSYFFYQ